VVPSTDEDLGGGVHEGNRARETSSELAQALSKVASSGYVRGQLNQLVVVRSGGALQKLEAHAEGAVHLQEPVYQEDAEINIDERLAELSAQLRESAGAQGAAADNPLAHVRAALESHFASEPRQYGPKKATGGGKKEVHAKRAAEARLKGYEGDACGSCGNFTLLRNGTCMKCDTCGGTSGCS
jgi:ribonucleoside-diphosphate reductase alpha chain